MSWRKLAATMVLVLCCGRSVSAHRLDELLQATILSVEKDQVKGSMRVIPGVAVAARVIASIDGDGDGVFSEAEQRDYAGRVLGGLSLSIDGTRLQPKLVSVQFPTAARMREGLGEIRIVFTAELPPGGRERRLVLQQPRQEKAAYLVNCTASNEKEIQIAGQHRNEDQSEYELDYIQSDVAAADKSDIAYSIHSSSC